MRARGKRLPLAERDLLAVAVVGVDAGLRRLVAGVGHTCITSSLPFGNKIVREAGAGMLTKIARKVLCLDLRRCKSDDRPERTIEATQLWADERTALAVARPTLQRPRRFESLLGTADHLDLLILRTQIIDRH